MRLLFDTRGVAHTNSHRAVLRETTRLGMMAVCAKLLGHDVQLIPNDVLLGTPERLKLFASVLASIESPHASFLPAEWTIRKYASGNASRSRMRKRHGLIVGVKGSEGVADDRMMLETFDALAAEEFDPDVAAHPSLLPMPYFIHDDMVGDLANRDLFGHFLTNRIGIIRGRLAADFGHYPLARPTTLTWIGAGAYGRSAAVNMIAAAMAHTRRMAANGITMTAQFTDSPNAERLPPWEYLGALFRSDACLHLGGNTPKANRLSEIVLAGSCVVAWPCPLRTLPEVDKTNSVVLPGSPTMDNEGAWAALGERLVNALVDKSRLRGLVEAADAAYINGWSPMGQVSQMLKFLQMDRIFR